MPPLKTGSGEYQGSARCGRIFLWAAEGREQADGRSSAEAGFEYGCAVCGIESPLDLPEKRR